MSFSSFLSGVSVACLLAVTAHAAEPLSPRVEVGVKGGTDRSLLTTEFWAPLAQKSDRVLYGDIRLMGDNDENREGNLGLGYRQIVDDAVLGVHGWIDRRRTQNNSTFHQLTFGVERLGHIVDARANVYVPLNQSRNIGSPNITTSAPYLAGNGIFYDVSGFLRETPQYGLDGEVGYRIPVFQKHVDAIRVYGGGYHFFRDETQDVNGFRVRTEAQVNSAFSVGARFQHDEPRGSQGFLEATIKFPFGAKKLYQTDYLRARLDESPERDVDIVTATQSAPARTVAALNQDGTAQRILYVDNTNAQAGDGSKDNPFNTLKAAEAALQANDILYVNRGTGTTTGMDQGIVIDKNNIQMIGSGSALTYNGFTLLDAGLAPVITNTETYVDNFTGNGVYINANNAFVTGLSITNTTGHGVFFNPTQSVDKVTVNNLSINGAQRYGAFFLNNSSHVTDQITVSNMQITGSTFFGLVFQNSAASHINAIDMTHINSSDNIQDGIHVAIGDANINRITANDVVTNSNDRYGVIIRSINAASVLENVSFTNLETNDNTSQGLLINAQFGQINNVAIDNMHAMFNTLQGAVFQASGAASLTGVRVTNSLFTSNVQSGIFVNNDTTGSFSVTLGDGTAGSGFNMIHSNNTSNGANHADIRLDLNGGVLSAQNNWWGQSSGIDGSQVINEGACPSCGTVDASMALASDPSNTGGPIAIP